MSPGPPPTRQEPCPASQECCKRLVPASPEKCMRSIYRDRLGLWGNDDGQSTSKLTGLDWLKNASLNKGLGFTIEERQKLGIHGLLPPRVKTQEQQVRGCKAYFDNQPDPLSKYMYLIALLDRHEHVFFRLVTENIKDMLPIIYTPTVGLACQKFGRLYRRPRGLFITIHDKGHVYEVLKNWPRTDVRAIVVTDGERILGLGDFGACGMAVPICQLLLYTILAGIKQHHCLPVTIDVGTNNQAMLEDPVYIGLRQPRVGGLEYDELIDEFMRAVVQRFGQNCVIQFEDFANENAFKMLEKYRSKYCVFSGDIQSTGAVVLAGLLASIRITGKKLSHNVILFLGAGEAAIGTAEIVVMAMKAEGTDEETARSRIWMVDSKGLVVRNRPEGGLTERKIRFARTHAPVKTLEEVIDIAKPSVLIGAAAVSGAFTPSILRKMAINHERPVIFAISNPASKTECTPTEAYTCTEDRAVYAAGSPFPDYHTKDNRVFRSGQSNNAYIFPGFALGIITVGIIDITDDFFLLAAEALAEVVTSKDLELRAVYPPLAMLPHCAVKIAKRIIEHAYKCNKASVFPQPIDIEAFIRAHMYDTTYSNIVPPVYAWPEPGPRTDIE